MIRSPGESMTEILFPSRLSNVNSYHSLIIWAVSWQNQQSDCAPSEDLDQPGHMPSLIRIFVVPVQPGHPPSLIRVFAVRMRKAWVFSYPLSAQRRLWSEWADAHQADLSLRWAHNHFVGFVMRQLICYIGHVVHPQLAETSIKEWIVSEFYYVNPWMDVLNVHF